MTIRVRFPGDIEVSTKFFGRFTPVDMVRGGAPLVPGLLLQSIVLVLIGALTGGLLLVYRPYGKPIDVLGYRYLRQQWYLRRGDNDSLDISVSPAVFGDSDIVVSDGVGAGVIRVDPVNVSMMTDVEQTAVQRVFRDALASASYPVTIYSRQETTSVPDYIDHLDERFAGAMTSSNEAVQAMMEDYLSHCRQLSDDGIELTRHYVVVPVSVDELERDTISSRTVRAASVAETVLDVMPDAVEDHVKPLATPLVTHIDRQDMEVTKREVYTEIDSRCREMKQRLNAGDLKAKRIAGDDLADFADTVSMTDIEPEVDGWRSDDGTYYKQLAVTEFPASMEFAWPRMLLRVDGFVDITQVVTPRTPADTAQTLERRKEKLRAERDSFLKAGLGNIEYLEARYEDAEWMLDLLANREDRPFDYAAYITVRGESYAKCEETFQQVTNRLRTAQIEFEKPVFAAERAADTYCPVTEDAWNEAQLMPGSSVAAGLPFATRQLDQEQGVLYGVDTDDGLPMLLDRFTWDSHSLVRIGTLGSGKSYATKLELLRMLMVYPELNIYVVDPKLEYKNLMDALWGRVHEVGSNTAISDIAVHGRRACFTPPERGTMDMDVMADLIRYLQHKTTENDGYSLVVIDEARHFLTHDDARTALNNFVLEARDTDTAVTLVTQNASHFTHSRAGTEILKNTPATVFMRHDTVDDAVIEFFDLSQREAAELHQLKTGKENPYSEALFQVDRQLDAKLSIEATPAEHRFIEQFGRY